MLSSRASPLGATFIFIKPPSFFELENRLRARGTETEEQVQKRLRNAKAEIEQGLSSGIFDHILENDDLEECYRNLKKLLGLDVTPDVSRSTEPYQSMNHLAANLDVPVIDVPANLDSRRLSTPTTPTSCTYIRHLIVLRKLLLF